MIVLGAAIALICVANSNFGGAIVALCVGAILDKVFSEGDE